MYDEISVLESMTYRNVYAEYMYKVSYFRAWFVIVFPHSWDFSHFVLIRECSIGPKPGTEEPRRL